MKLKTISELPECRLLVEGSPDREISKVFCCDLLSIAMSRIPEGSVWVTVMGNKNTLAVATLMDVPCIVLAEGISPDQGMISKAEEEGIAIYTTELPVFDIALKIHEAGIS